MSLADQLEVLIAKSKVADGKGSSAKVLQDALEVMGFVATNLPAISAALRGRDAVLREAAKELMRIAVEDDPQHATSLNKASQKLLALSDKNPNKISFVEKMIRAQEG